ncbi:MAG TPA: MFS transporter [Streptosporangiaceae bacterium]
MGNSGAREAARTAASATGAAARAGRSATRGTAKFIHRLTNASGAGRTGLGNLIELTAAGSIGDAFVAVSLAGTIFFSTSVAEARGRVALFLVITMAPFAVLAPFIGPMLDRVQEGRRYILAGTLLARGLLCWGMSAAVKNSVTLLPAAFGILVLQKAYGVARASIAPRLLPSEITLVKANARSALAALIASSIGAPVAAGVDALWGPAWVLRFGTVIYIAAMTLALRLPSQVDRAPADAEPTQPLAERRPADPDQPGYRDWPDEPDRPGYRDGPDERGQSWPGDRPPPQPSGRKRFKTLQSVGPVVGEAMRGNATLRALSGYMIFFLAFLLRSDHFHGVSKNVALGAMVGAAAAGGLVAMGIGSMLRSRAPQVIMFGMLVLATVSTALCAWFFSLYAALIVAFVAACGTALAKLALDSIVQHEIGEEIRSSAFAASETLHQLSWVAGGLAGLVVSYTNSGTTGLAIAAAGLAVSFGLLISRRRHRILAAAAQDSRQAPSPG